MCNKLTLTSFPFSTILDLFLSFQFVLHLGDGATSMGMVHSRDDRNEKLQIELAHMLLLLYKRRYSYYFLVHLCDHINRNIIVFNHEHLNTTTWTLSKMT